METDMQDMMEKKRNNIRYIRVCGMYLVLFFVSLAFYGISMAVNGIYPFGSKSFLYQDAYDQYTGILQIVLEWADTGFQSSFLWEYGLGVDVILNVFYYCMSPFNLIAVALGAERVELSMTLMIVLKASLLAPTMLFFFRHSKMKDYADAETKPGFLAAISMTLSLAYAFGGFMVAYHHNVIWMDGLLLLPFLAVAVERLAKGEWKVRYTLLLAAVFLMNFYFAWYICLFVICYFLLQSWNGRNDFFRGVGRFFLWSALAVLIAGVVLFPSFYAVLHTSSVGDGDYSLPWYRLSNLGMFINSFYPLREISIGYLFSHNNYCGVITVLLLFLFFGLKAVARKTKLKYAAVLAFLVIGLNVTGANYVLHGFTVTHGMGNRFAFLLLFFMLLAAYITLVQIRDVSIWKILAAVGICLALFLTELFLNTEDANAYSYVAVMLLGCAYVVLLILRARGSIACGTFYVWTLSLLVVELFVNAWDLMPQKYNEKRLSEDMQTTAWETDYQELATENGERKTALVTEAYVPDSEVNWYSSVTNGATIDSFASLGVSHYQSVEYTCRGLTPVTALLYNVRYVLTNEIGTVGGYHLADTWTDDIKLYEADTLAGMGFLMQEDITEWTGLEAASDTLTYGSAAENQNALVTLATGGEISEAVFESREIPEDAVSGIGIQIVEKNENSYTYSCENDINSSFLIEFTAVQDDDLYLECTDNRPQVVEVKVNGEATLTTSYTDEGGLYHIGEVKAGDTVRIRLYALRTRLYTTSEDDENGTKTFALYALRSDVAEQFAAYAKSHQMIFDGYDGNTLNGTIDAATDGILYLAVPYKEGFTATVDGEEAEVIKLGTGLTGIRISAGTHKIALTYHTPWLAFGAWMSFAGILLLAGYAVGKRKRTSRA